MSDVWQGPGWWLASDGKWYPADAQPGGGTAQTEATTEAAGTTAETASTLVADPVEAAPTAEQVPTTPAPVFDAPATTVPTFDTPPPTTMPEMPASVDASPEAPAPMPAPEVDPVEPARGGWQAIEPDPAPTPDAEPAPEAPTSPASEQPVNEPGEAAEPPTVAGGEWTEPAVAAADTPSLDSNDDGWTSAYEMAQAEVEPILPDGEVATPAPEIVPPTPPEPTDATVIPDVPAPSAVSMADPTAPAVDESPLVDTTPDVTVPDVGVPDVAPPPITTVPDRSGMPQPVARDGAWRKPSDTPASSSVASDAGSIRPAPQVVDLAIPPESPLNTEWEPPKQRKSRLPGILMGLLVLLICVGIAVAIGWFFTRDDGSSSDVDSTESSGEEVADTPPSSEASAPSSTPDTSEAPTEDLNAGVEVSVFELRAGDCIQGEIGSGQVQQLIKVDCSVPHEFEVYREALIEPSVSTFDEAAISAQAEEVCRTSLAAYIPPDDERNIKFKWFQPTEESWNQETNPDRVITCLLFDEDGALTGRAGDTSG